MAKSTNNKRSKNLRKRSNKNVKHKVSKTNRRVYQSGGASAKPITNNSKITNFDIDIFGALIECIELAQEDSLSFFKESFNNPKYFLMRSGNGRLLHQILDYHLEQLKGHLSSKNQIVRQQNLEEIKKIYYAFYLYCLTDSINTGNFQKFQNYFTIHEYDLISGKVRFQLMKIIKDVPNQDKIKEIKQYIRQVAFGYLIQFIEQGKHSEFNKTIDYVTNNNNSIQEYVILFTMRSSNGYTLKQIIDYHKIRNTPNINDIKKKFNELVFACLYNCISRDGDTEIFRLLLDDPVYLDMNIIRPNYTLKESIDMLLTPTELNDNDTKQQKRDKGLRLKAIYEEFEAMVRRNN